MALMTVIFIADVVGKPGRHILSQMTRRLKYKYQADYVIANTENAAGGYGITPEMSRKVFSYGVDCQTSGNHIWDRMAILEYIEEEPRLIRPANYAEAPGKGHYVGETEKGKIVVLSLMGRTYMHGSMNCPFQEADRLLEMLGREGKTIIVDMHAEATSEKQAMAFYLDGRVSAVIGTHTHVQTADEKISERGTAYITDVGLTGAHDAILGMNKGAALGRFLTGMPKRLSVSDADVRIDGVVLKINMDDEGRAESIERFSQVLDLSWPMRDPEEVIADAGEADQREDDCEEDQD